jgi:hypothetical protein
VRVYNNTQFIVVLLALWLSACESATPLQPTLTLYPTSTATIATPEPSASPTLRPTRLPTRTPVPSFTPPPTVTPRPIITEVIEGTSQPFAVSIETFTSPDTNWVLEIARKETVSPASEDDACHYEIKFTSSNGITEWVIDQQTDYSWICGFFKPFQWTQDGLYAYLLYQPASDGCFTATPTLKRVNLQTGQLEEIAYGDRPVLSRDENFLAYTNNNELEHHHYELVIQNLSNHNERKVEFEAMWIDGIVWSPDNSSIALTLVNNACDFWETSIIVVDADNDLSYSVLTDFSDDGLLTTAWLEPQIVQVTDANSTNRQLNIVTGEITND